MGGFGSEILQGVGWVVGMCSSGQYAVKYWKENGNLFDIGAKNNTTLFLMKYEGLLSCMNFVLACLFSDIIFGVGV